MAYFTRAVPYPSGFYRALHNCSTADVNLDVHAKPTICSLSAQDLDDPDVYEVERLVESRRTKGGVEYLVLWAGYRKEEATWVDAKSITRPALEYFADPKPSIRDILDSTSAFCNAVSRSLKRGVNKECRLTVNFRSDVFRFLFKDKGSEYPHGKGSLYKLEDFNTTYFPSDWYRVHDRLGDGCKIEFPMRLLSKVKWSPTVYTTHRGSVAVHPKKKYFDEVCMAWVAKQRC